MKPPLMSRSITPIEATLGLLACISLLIIIAPKDFASKTLELEVKNYPVYIGDDSFTGGDSKASWADEASRQMRCEMGQKYINPYCSMVFTTLSDTWSGIDLRDFKTMRVWGSYEGPGKHIRLYLRNRHPRYYVQGNDSSTKYNMVEFPIEDLNKGITIHLSDFGVADWWLTTNNIKLEDSHAEFNDIVFIEVQTGSQERFGTHDIRLDKIEWQGDLISDETLYRGMVLFWSVSIFIVLLYRIIRLKIEVNKHQRYEQELVSINKFLNLQNKHFEDLAKTDQLTGCLNRIGIRDELYEGLQRWKEKRQSFSIILIDLDNFKKINDTHGHDVGDKILVGAADILRSNIRHSDSLARWGGEEFILVCAKTDLNQAKVVAELLRSKLQDEKLHANIQVTASFGVSTLTTPDLDAVFKAADEALYEAKGSGRNCVIAKTPETD